MNNDQTFMRSPKELGQCEKRKGVRTEPYRVPTLEVSPPKRPRQKGYRGRTNITETEVVEFQEERSDW